jgi:SAM-dependent methyltransferase
MCKDADKIIDLYDRHAASWDRLRARELMEKAWLDRFLALVPTAGSILDIGCGSAEPIDCYLIGAGHRLTGVDSSTAMIAMCKNRFPNHEWVVEDMRTLSLARRFNGSLAWDSFFHLTQDDQRRMFPIFAAHSEPNAALMFTSGPRRGEAIGTFQGEPLFHASLDADEYRFLLGKFGFELVSYVAEDAGCGWHTVWLARFRRSGD